MLYANDLLTCYRKDLIAYQKCRYCVTVLVFLTTVMIHFTNNLTDLGHIKSKNNKLKFKNKLTFSRCYIRSASAPPHDLLP